MKFENTEVFNFKGALRGMRNPKNSWDRSDSRFDDGDCYLPTQPSCDDCKLFDGFAVATSTGSKDNDGFKVENGHISKTSNHAGGVLGGISDGSPIVLRAAIKPTPSIAMTQQTVNKSMENIDINIKGRHDPIIVPRAVVVVESMVAITIVDLLFQSMTSRMDNIIKFFK